jgi:hypothetical protein
VFNSIYSNTDTLRIGFTADYSVSQDLTLTGGINYAALDYNDLQAGGGASSVDEELLNVFVGVNLRVTDNVSQSMLVTTLKISPLTRVATTTGIASVWVLRHDSRIFKI